MFQPQPTPFSAFSASSAFSSPSYGVAHPIPEYCGFQPAPAVASGGPTLFRDPVFPPVPPTPTPILPNARRLNYSHARSPHYKMDPSDLEAQEALAKEYQPALEGPLVGEKKSSHAVTEEYAKADPIYVAKTAALPQTYSHYRPILGDGNCGWRAVGFAYFETLIQTRNYGQIEEEVARMISLNNLLTTQGGFEAWLLEDFVEETTSLLTDLANLAQESLQAAHDLLWERFNNIDSSASIVYHLRLLASSWLAANGPIYQGFIPDGTSVDTYRKSWIEPVNLEIDHLGMTLLIDILLKPIGITVEIVYLDRSEGTQANSHLFQSEDANGVPTSPGAPIIHLLYRPSHYDILYKDPSPPVQPLEDIQQSIQVHRAITFSRHEPIQSNPAPMGDFDMSALLGIPGFSLAPQPVQNSLPQYRAPLEQPYTPSTISSSMSPISPVSSATTPCSFMPATYSTQAQSPSSLTSPMGASPHPTFTPANPQCPILTQLPPPARLSITSLPSELSSPGSASSFRPSKYEYEAAADWQEPVVFQTSTFKNSHYNTAHYNNPNFQPEAWTPDCEEPPSRKKSS